MDAAARGTGNAPLLAVDNVTLQYKTEQHLVTATYRVGFEVFAGERYVVLGPSGCGKSTILKAVAGFMQPVEGQIRLNGKQIKQPGSDRMMVFQEFDQLLPWKTVLGNVLFPLLVNRRMPKAEATEHARDLAMEPAVLLMDEPFAALDALTRRKMQEELKALWDDVGFTVLFVTHSIEEALLVGSRILVLSPHPGRVK